MGLGSPAIYKLKIFSRTLMALLPILAPPLCASPLRESISLAFLDGPECYCSSLTLAMASAGKMQEISPWPVNGQADQCRALLPSIYKSWAKLSPVTEGFKSLRRNPNICLQSGLLCNFPHFFSSFLVFLFNMGRIPSSPNMAESEQRASFPIKWLEHLSDLKIKCLVV